MKNPAFLAAALLSLTLAAPVSAADATHDSGQKSERVGQKAADKVKSAAHQTGDFVSDAALTAKVKTALIAEDNLPSMSINVDSKDGVVTLTGELPTAASVTQAETATRKVDGVKEVLNRLTVKAS